MLHQRFSGFRGDNLCGEAVRPVSGGDDNTCSQESILIALFPVGSKLQGESSDEIGSCQIQSTKVQQFIHNRPYLAVQGGS
jgi:hypothetical protein